MPKARRGELWMADLGFVAKVRPVLILSVNYRNDERAVVSYVIRTTSVRGTQYEVPHLSRGMPEGAFDAQGIASIPDVKLDRRLGMVDAATLAKVETAVRSWLALWLFTGTRVPIETLFDYLMQGSNLDEFLECFPTVKRQDALLLLDHYKQEALAEAAA